MYLGSDMYMNSFSETHTVKYRKQKVMVRFLYHILKIVLVENLNVNKSIMEQTI